MFHRILLYFQILLYPATVSHAVENKVSDASADGITFFESKIRPLLINHCYECHSVESGVSDGNLRLDSQAATRRGGDRGAAVVPGDPDASWILKAVLHVDPDLKMPPKRERLSDESIADLRKWIEMGAPDPRLSDPPPGKPAWQKASETFWAYQQPRKSAIPSVKNDKWAATSIDHFVLAMLEQQKLQPSGDAEPEVLLRRLYFDFVGLPPSPETLSQFFDRIDADGFDIAWVAEVDTLLASPQFGVRWGRHWLDVARFAESSGTEANITFPYAWRYRDYCINSFNDDIPFDRFLLEQLAGDLLHCENDQERAKLLIATGFLAIGPKNLDSVDQRQFHADVVDEQIDTVTRAIIGNSVACARCHDHKFDPFTMTDYYALAGIFASTKTFFGTAVSPSNRIGGDPLMLPISAGQPVLHASIPKERVAKLKSQLSALRAEKQQMDDALKAVLSGATPEKTFTLQDALRVFWQTGGVEGELEKVSESGQALPLTMGVLEADTISNAHLLERGDINKPGTVIQRGLPLSIHPEGSQVIPTDKSGRLELARWLTSPAHPLTARVIVNRVWSHMFGVGIVATVDNFGSTGQLPSHPELLDTLAVEFADNGWSIKQLLRQIAVSRTYRQSSEYRHEAFLSDPDNRLLWRVPKRRLEAESIRDSMLSVSGEINFDRPAGSLVGRVIGDRPVSLIGLDKRLPPDLDGSLHRSVYLPVIRDRLPDVLELFDFAEPSLVVGSRETTNVPIQAHYLLNSPFVQQRAQQLANRIKTEATDEQRVEMAFVLCFSREPDEFELQRSLAFLCTEEDVLNKLSETKSQRLIVFCQALLATAEFRNID
jgi:hypothetical protein